MTYACHDRTCAAIDCETCNPGCHDPVDCPDCGQTVKASKMQTCQKCGGEYCADCLTDGICNECEKESEVK